ncbi:methyl-accepting chemotaxis protein [Gilvimarinus sp. SDUM040013]|uniref:Methyl-accepting chemotaxis protein n=1 Tax=Gilvimarinus gilvus TaxID=3058038 RepID=A0ABU4S4A8_9GAMM|nr:methyl-accepting chemotaxis protein [Gilvimarinus sp. SDUM040013]MDO3387586.1 methyl-accepting chemotaxis protein [Gilvimarinus sp. SDUM040013]MDX6850149.1 methyl-accepting chemotaxis protein [Gilvimarinus sp. SDUM040013]
MKTESRTIAATIKGNPAIVLAGVLLVVFLIAAAVVFTFVQRNADNDQRQLQQTAELRAQAFRLTGLTRDATAGDEEAFGELAAVVSTIDSTWTQLRASDTTAGDVFAEQFGAFGGVWREIKAQAAIILENQDNIVFINDKGRELNANLPSLQALHNVIADILLDTDAPAEQLSQARMQAWRAERIGRNVDKMLRGGDESNVSSIADQFNRDANLYQRVLNAMQKGDDMMGISQVADPDARASLEEVSELFEGISGSIQTIFNGAEPLFEVRQAEELILDQTPVLLQALSEISDTITAQETERPLNENLMVGLVAAAILALGVIGLLLYQGTRRRLAVTAETNERNQTAILRLLDELADLADGDLTTTATVTEDFTGAIADSINYTIDQLRILVARINETAVNVSAAAQETQQTALHLAEASEHQAQEIAGASAAVNEMAVTIDQVSANASESAAVAERAVSIASNGAKVVQNTINGMDTIREQIQDTSKRIKRLGESSQEIGDIVSLINDIADQTNILALNAAIQASMAGDAGRGFAVVADEVQRLAERSAAATKQIEALVKTIQNDTNEAVISMEQTTSEVVRGARLAQDAGVALEEIENVSSNLAELIQNISNAARQQASSAGHISNTMNVIQEITTQTSAGTSATAQSIGNLAAMAMDLRESVAGFKLPEEDTGDTGIPSFGQTPALGTSVAPEGNEEEFAEVVDLDDSDVVDLSDEVEIDIDGEDDLDVTANRQTV